jgi:hypothetical protein
MVRNMKKVFTGTYGSSMEYLFWFDVDGKYHQLFPTCGTTIHISDSPIRFGDLVQKAETSKE